MKGGGGDLLRENLVAMIFTGATATVESIYSSSGPRLVSEPQSLPRQKGNRMHNI